MSAINPPFICASCVRSMRRYLKPTQMLRTFSNNATQAVEVQTSQQPEDYRQVPRWKQTPPAMKMRFRIRPSSRQKPWKIEEDPVLLDDVLDTFMKDGVEPGVRGSSLLEEEVKWLAVTHKSFEQGARGFNDRLALLGKRILDVETSKALLQAPSNNMPQLSDPTTDGNAVGPLQKHPALDGVENITAWAKTSFLNPTRLAELDRRRYGIHKVLRWVPKQTELLTSSGQNAVVTGAMYAIIGALAMQKGGKIASDVAKAAILKPLGL